MPDHADVWTPYGRSLIRAMAEVLAEIPEAHHAHLLETADYWLSVGLVLGIEQPAEACRLLLLVEADATERAALSEDAGAFLAEALP